MQYGYFDDQAKEYVITRPDTPRSWTNYLGSTRYGGSSRIMPAAMLLPLGRIGRLTRFHTNAIPMDQPGRYLYLRDRAQRRLLVGLLAAGGQAPDRYRSVCRHGTAYTVISASYAAIEARRPISFRWASDWSAGWWQ